MQKPMAAAAALILSFAVGFLVSRTTADPAPDGAGPTIDIPATALKSWYPPVQEFESEGEPLDDERFDALMAALDEAMTAEETLADLERSIEPNVQGFFRRIAMPELSEEQTQKASDYLKTLAEQYPEHESLIQRQVSMLGIYGPAYPVVPSFTSAVRSFAYPDELVPEGGSFEDAHVGRMLAGLDAMLELPETADDFEREAGSVFAGLTRRLQYGQLTDAQTERILAHFEAFREANPDLGEMIDERRHYVEHLLPGRVAQSTAGKDLDGVEFSLEEYRGNIVVLVFSGEWCGPCRGEYPYHRFAVELYEDYPVVFLGVNSDADPKVILESKARGDAPAYRTWWDGHSQPDADVVAADGPIANAWNVRGWPSIFVLDQEGVIRHIDPRGGDLIATLDDMMSDIRMARFQAEQAAARETDVDDQGGSESPDENQ